MNRLGNPSTVFQKEKKKHKGTECHNAIQDWVFTTVLCCRNMLGKMAGRVQLAYKKVLAHSSLEPPLEYIPN